ncbi:succinate dehydrogenase, cytochrome b556 subunit [Acidovorax sp. SRB_14]|uniref:succinate dehydrogenase, cytochrome b556 subunit n=1 Tax=Acidovorax sp. SRB_14 TaxID=1962699 RepID=UPI001564ABC9|nr:succinate dehydrogenase, cytochrome b556 subunit [Acidovorax sp. SRB_14]NMM80718.1 succinate dehydrogenase, cytochrome b556 subunit [Acidovorax sp. SRB_14]
MRPPALIPRKRPLFLNLAQIAMPVGAVTSICHRLSGMLLAAGVPAALYLLGRSLDGEAGFAQVAGVLRQPWAKAWLVALAWALAHHALAGVRHLLTDINAGSTLGAARRSAWGVNLAALAVALLALGAVR